MQLAQAYRVYNVILTPGEGVELDSHGVIFKCFEVIMECTSKGEAGSVVGIGISCQGEAFIAVDRNGKFPSNAMVSSEKRVEKYTKTWPDQFGADRLFEADERY
jgi:sugar (pentulose or hexulose) kinase